MSEKNLINRIVRDMAEQDQPVQPGSTKVTLPPHMGDARLGGGYVDVGSAARARERNQKTDDNLNSVPPARKP